MDGLEQLLTKDQVCELLGVTDSWLNAEVRAGRIPHLQLGTKKVIRFRPSQIEQYLTTKEAGIG